MSQQRPDIDLQQRVLLFLSGRGIPTAQLDVRAQGEAVDIRGEVRSAQMPRLIEQCCRRVAGVRSVCVETLIIPRLRVVSAAL